MTDYRLLVGIGQPEDLLLFAGGVKIDYHRIDPGTGEVIAVAQTEGKAAIATKGIEVTPGRSYYLFGFTSITEYSGFGVDEADWGAKSIGTLTDLDPTVFVYEAGAGRRVIRPMVLADQDTPNDSSRWYITEYSSVLPYFRYSRAWADGVSQGNFESSTNWQELSGITAAYKSGNSNHLWVLSDSPANMIAAVSKTDASNKGVWSLSPAPTKYDWEDIESSVVDGVPYLYIFDFGNNPNSANSRGAGIDMIIHRVVEPSIIGIDGTTTNFISINCAFPTVGAPTLRDCEAAIIDPATGDIYIITKREAIPGVYKLSHQSTYSGIQTLAYLGKMYDIPDVTTSALGSTLCNVVDATINKAGTELIVKNYNTLYLFTRNPNTQTIFEALQSTNPTIIDGYVGGGSATPAKSHPSAEPQGEGICFDELGIHLYSNSEYVSTAGSTPTRYPLFKYSRLNSLPVTKSFQDGVEGYAGTQDTYIWDSFPTTAYGSAVTFVVDNVDATEVGRRKGLLKFDLSEIPSNAVIVGARVDLNIAVEGQGWSMYKMLVPWSEGSTYNSLGGVTPDGIKAASAPDCVNGVNLDSVTASVRNNVSLATVQSWVDGSSPNYGWMFDALDSATGDGVQFSSREDTTPANRPKLTIRYTLPSAPAKVWAELDLGDEKPAMTYQANDIAELKDLKADYSQEIKLPLTAHNISTLMLPDRVDSETVTPYRLMECRLFAGGHELAGRGSVLFIDSTEEDCVAVQVLGAVSGLFDTLEDTPMSALTEPSFRRDYSGTDFLPGNFPPGCEFVAASFTKGGFHHLLEMDPRYMLPVINDVYLMGKIFESQGFTWVHNLGVGTPVTKNALPVVTLDLDTDSFANLGNVATRGISTILGPRYYVPAITSNASNTLTVVGSDSSSTLSYLEYKALCDCEFDLNYTRSRIVVPDQRSKPFNTNIVCSSQEEDVFVSTGEDEVSFSGHLSLSKGDTITLTVLSHIQYEPPATPIADYTHTLTITNFTAEQVPLYGKVHIPRNLGFETQFDYLKSFVQRYGLIIGVNYSNRTVYTYTLEKLYDEKLFALDWSDKVAGKAKVDFVVGEYAQSNTLSLKDNDEDGVKDNASFTVPDETLEKTKSLFDLPFEAGLDWGVTTKYASVPVFDVPDLDLTDEDLDTDSDRLRAATYSDGGKPHLLRLTTNTKTLLVYDGASWVTESYNTVEHVTAQSLLDEFYSELSGKLLVKAKAVTQKFALTPADIEGFDPFKPIYLEQHGAYFYVNKINNFIEGQLTTVELIRL